MKNILLGVSGSIAAYKAAAIAHTLVNKGFAVQVIMTANAQKFITPLTFQTLTKQKVYTGMFEEAECLNVRHISIADNADMAIIAPATANIIGKLAYGIADDSLSTTIMALGKKPLLVCPAMNTAMWENSAVQNNITTLKNRGVFFEEPKTSLLACGTTGVGALADADNIIKTALSLL
jgi:phosphopantothenoylcysteine decarboxylase/phosphopantothenoylcysteine decarboxylase/phosphopantothenate--cysteine ligase